LDQVDDMVVKCIQCAFGAVHLIHPKVKALPIPGGLGYYLVKTVSLKSGQVSVIRSTKSAAKID
jgi:hypothetical protein